MDRRSVLGLLALFAAIVVTLAGCAFEESPEVAAQISRITEVPAAPTATAAPTREPTEASSTGPLRSIGLSSTATASPPGPTATAAPTATAGATETAPTGPMFGPRPTGPAFVPEAADLVPFQPLHAVGRSLTTSVGWVPKFIADRSDAPNPVSGITPNGRGLYVPIPDPDGRRSCDGEVGGALGIVPIDRRRDVRPAEPAAELPMDISAVHYGPGNRVILYSSCSKYSSPSALARVTPEGDFTDLHYLDSDQTDQTLWVWEPSWFVDSDGAVKVVIPQEGVFPPGEQTGTATLIVDFESGAIEDVWATDYIAQVAGASGLKLMATKRQIMTPDHVLGEWDGPAGFETSINGMIAVTGDDGAWLLTPRSTSAGVGVIKLTDEPATGAAWEPTGQWVAITGPSGTVPYDIDGYALPRISFAPSSEPHFSAQMESLVVREASPNGDVYRAYKFMSVRDPDIRRIPAKSELSSGGLGELRIGMTVGEASELLDVEFEVTHLGHLNTQLSAGECTMMSSPDLPNLWFMGEATSADTDEVEIMVIENDSPMYLTPSRVRVGMTKTKVLETFPDQIQVTPHVYHPMGWYLDYLPSDEDETTSVRFVVTGEQVDSIRVGDIGWVRAIEGCA